jgi:hypothetical protein
MSNRFDIARGIKPPEPEKLDIDPLIKYQANKNLKSIMIEFRQFREDDRELDKYVNYLGKTLSKKQVAMLFADNRRLRASCKNYFNKTSQKANNGPMKDSYEIELEEFFNNVKL